MAPGFDIFCFVPLSLAVALLLLVGAAAALWVGEQALTQSRDFAAAYWLITGAASLRASLLMAEARP